MLPGEVMETPFMETLNPIGHGPLQPAPGDPL